MIKHTDSCRTRISRMYDCNCPAGKLILAEEKAAQIEREHLLGMRNTHRDECVDQEIHEQTAREWEKANPKYIWRSDLKSGIEYPEFNQNKIGTLEDKVHYPPHYRKHPSGIECIQITEHFNFNKGNAIKYIWRSDLKNGIEDLEKANWYITREIERIKNENQARSGIQDNGSSEAKGNF